MPLSPLGKENELIITQGFRANPNRFGYGKDGHTGIDIRARTGTPLFACIYGRGYLRTDRNWFGKLIGYGNAWIFDWEFPTEIIRFLYGHMQKRNYTLNEKLIPEGTFVGEADNSGNSRGSHLHFEMRRYIKGRPGYTLLNPVEEFFKKYSIPYRWN